MNRFFYQKLAIANIRKNKVTYIPYILTCIFTIMMYYIMHSLSRNSGLTELRGAANAVLLLNMGTVIIMIFSVIFLFYTNQFLIKRRKKELGMFNILGLDRRHIAKMMMWETLMIAVVSLLIGAAGGILLSKLMFLLLLKMLRYDVVLGFFVSGSSILAVSVLFSCIFLLNLVFNLLQVRFANPIELLRGGQQGEKEPKTHWIFAVIGIVTLGAGYVNAVRIESPLEAINIFFIAVLLVIIGTYCLFAAGSIALLKILKKNKKIYYKTKNFTIISGMIYRMKQNAVGLANICILSTAVLVILSTTISLYVGQESLLTSRFQKDISIVKQEGTKEEINQILERAEETASDYSIQIDDILHYEYQSIIAAKEKDRFVTSERLSDKTNASIFQFIELEDYNRIEGTNQTLEGNEILLYSIGKDYKQAEITIGNATFLIKEELAEFSVIGKGAVSIVSQYYIIVKDKSVFAPVLDGPGGRQQEMTTQTLSFNTIGEESASIAFSNGLEEQIKDLGMEVWVDNYYTEREDIYVFCGGFLFIGIFLGLLFLMATILIIYYKQITEGFDDKERFQIMQKVGMSEAEVKQSIQNQILMVFFLPLITAIVHIGFAFPVITKLLGIFYLADIPLFVICTLSSILFFTVVYGIVYKMTARTYYNIVR